MTDVTVHPYQILYQSRKMLVLHLHCHDRSCRMNLLLQYAIFVAQQRVMASVVCLTCNTVHQSSDVTVHLHQVLYQRRKTSLFHLHCHDRSYRVLFIVICLLISVVDGRGSHPLFRSFLLDPEKSHGSPPPKSVHSSLKRWLRCAAVRLRPLQ